MTDIGVPQQLRRFSMSTFTTTEKTFQEAATYGGLVDAIGGVATVVLAIIALSGVHEQILAAIATVVFAAALLILGGTMLTEYTKMAFPSGMLGVTEGSGGGLSALFLTGAAGIVLGVLSLLGIFPQVLISVAVIAFGGAMLLSSGSVWHLYRLKNAFHRIGATTAVSGADILAGEMASGSAAMQCLAGLAAIVLGILAVTGINAAVLSLVALLVLGGTVLLTGSTLTAAVTGLVEPNASATREGWSSGSAE
jgi:hypothetical protein